MKRLLFLACLVMALMAPQAAIGQSGYEASSGVIRPGGFDKTLQHIPECYPNLQGIYDVKIDVHVVGVLTVFQRLCTEITAQGFR